MKRISFALAGALALSACGDSGDQARKDTQATPEAAVAANTPKGASAESRGQQLLREAERAANVGRDLEARQTYERALAAFRSDGDRTSEGRTLLAMGSLDRAMGQGERGRQVLGQAEAVFAAAGDARGQADATFALGELERAQFNNERAREVFDLAVERYHALQDWGGEARSLLGRADSERRLGLILAARRDAARALAIFTTTGDAAGATLARRTQDEVTGNYPDDFEAERVEHRNQILATQQAGEPIAEAQEQLEFARLEHRTWRPLQAREVYGKALVLYREARDVLGQIYATIGLADLERGVERHEAARALYADAQMLIRELGDPQAEAHVLIALAEMNALAGADSRQALQQALEMNRTARNQIGEAMAQIALGRIEQRGGNPMLAERNFCAAHDMLIQNDDEVGAADALLALASLLRETGRGEEAADTLVRARVVFEATGYRLGEARTLKGLGDTLRTTQPIEAQVNYRIAAYLFDTMGMAARSAEAEAAANSLR